MMNHFMTILLLQGIITGIVLSMPMGPISILCIQRTLYYGIKIGLLTAIGSALADGIFASLAVFGLTAITHYFSGYQFWIHLIGGLFLLYLGVSMLCSPPRSLDGHLQKTTSLRAFISAFLMTITNPVTIFSFMALFEGLRLINTQHTSTEAWMIVFGIMIGSSLWEFTLSISIQKFLFKHMSVKMMRIINVISGSTLLVFSALALKI